MTKTTNKYASQMTEKVTLADLVAERRQWYEMSEALRKIIRQQERQIWELENNIKNFNISIDMSIANKDDTAGNRIFGKVIDIQKDTLLCEFTSANYNYNGGDK